MVKICKVQIFSAIIYAKRKAMTKDIRIIERIIAIVKMVIMVLAMPLPRYSPSESSMRRLPFKARKKPIIHRSVPMTGINIPGKNKMAAHFTCGS